jgi:hypothetical protein
MIESASRSSQVHLARTGHRVLQRGAKPLQALQPAADGKKAPARIARHGIERESRQGGERRDRAFELAQELREGGLPRAALRGPLGEAVDGAPVVERQALA